MPQLPLLPQLPQLPGCFLPEIIMAVAEVLQDLLESGAHFGHQTRRWNPKMKPFIYASRDGVHIFDLTITAARLEAACEFIKQSAAEGKNVVFVGTKRQARPIIREEAVKAGAPFVAERWLGGTITNWEEVGDRIKQLRDMKHKRETGGFDKYTKKERVLIDRQISRLERFLGGLEKLTAPPQVLFVVDTLKEKVAIKEAKNRGLKVVAMVDTNSDPESIAFPIPANDDAVRSIKYIVSRIASAYAEGKAISERNKPTPEKREEAAKPVKGVEAKK
jgi:small subunit ribosomal protein S2